MDWNLPEAREQSSIDGTVFKIPQPLKADDKEKEKKKDTSSPDYSLKGALDGHKRGVTALHFAPSGSYLLSGSADRTLNIWDVRTSQLEKTLTGHTLGINDVSWSPDNKYLISCSDDKTIKLWNPHSGECLKTMMGHTAYVFACRINPQANLIASTSFDHTVRLWDVRTGKTLKVVPAHMDPISSVDFNRDGSLFVTGSFDGLVRLGETVSGQVLKTLIDEDNSPVGYVKFAPNGRYILAAYLNSQIKLWNFQKPKCLRVYKGHTNRKFCIAVNFSVTAGMWVASGSEDSCLYLWSLQSKELVQQLPAHQQELICSDCHPTENIIATGALQDTENLKLWQSGETNN